MTAIMSRSVNNDHSTDFIKFPTLTDPEEREAEPQSLGVFFTTGFSLARIEDCYRFMSDHTQCQLAPHVLY
jgi:hypothetical protein